MTVTATEFKVNFGKYLSMLKAEDVFITKNGKIIAKVSNPNTTSVDAISGILAGHIPQDYSRKDLHMERLSRYEIND